MMDEQTLEKAIRRLSNLPTLPGIAIKLLEAVKDENCSLRDIGEIISKDPPLSGKILKLINSPFYGQSTKVTSVPHAISLLGVNTVKNTALSFSLLRTSPAGNKKGFNYTEFWKSSLISALASRSICREVFPSFAENAFFLGLLHNIGMLALNQALPSQYGLVLQEMRRSTCPCQEAETQVIGFNHMDVGGYLTKQWGLPEEFYHPITYHHYPKRFKGADPRITVLMKILHLSSLFSDVLTGPEKTYSLGLLEVLTKEYGFLDPLRIDIIGREIHEQTVDIFPLFEVKIEKETSYLDILEEARAELINLSSIVLMDLAEQKNQLGELREQVMRDGLTNVFNYKGFYQFLENELYRAKRYRNPLSLIIADIDHFKEINDTCGHLVGDQVLKAVAQTLNATLRKSDILARYGGDEFAIILPECGPKDALSVAERLRKVIESSPIEHEQRKVVVTMSFGVTSLAPEAIVSGEDLIRKADAALYQTKNAGRNRCCAA